MQQKIKVGAVSYLNTKPLVYGFEQGMMQDTLEMFTDYPAAIAKKLLGDEIDLGLVPVAVLPKMQEYHIVSDYCIGCDGAVASVCLFSDVPLEEISTILVDYQSRTSAALLKLLLQQHWKINAQLIYAEKGFEQQIKGTTAGLVIGDRAFAQIKKNTFHFDLGLAWKQMTGQPFVFAVWVSNKKLNVHFTEAFNTATGYGLNYLTHIAQANATPAFDMLAYYSKYISYQFNLEKKAALNNFLQLL